MLVSTGQILVRIAKHWLNIGKYWLDIGLTK